MKEYMVILKKWCTSASVFVIAINPPLDKYLYETFFKDKKCGFSIEAGASNGILENSTKFFEEYLISILQIKNL